MLADPQTLALLQARTRHIRNICILAHVDHGKTTLSDYLLSSNGIISPKLAGKVRFLDSRPDEQERGITMKSTSIALLFNDKRAQQEAALVAALSAGAAAPPADLSSTPMTTPAGVAASSSNDLYLINLIDSPGHVDFSSEVSNAVRVSDGCLVLVDVLEGICVQTHAVLRQAWNEGVKPVLVLNKIDRLISELQMDALEAYRHIVKILEQVNVIASTFITAEAMETAAKRKTPATAEPTATQTDGSTAASAAASADYEVEIDDAKQWTFAPELGNVVFASAYDCWAFTIPQFSTMLAAKLGGGMKPSNLQKVLWGEFYFDAKNKKVLTKPTGKCVTPMFVHMIFENLFALYQTVLVDKDDVRMEKIISALGLKVLPRELSSSKEPRTKLQLLLSKWLPIPAAILGAVVDHLPDPITAQGYRLEKFWPGIYLAGDPLTDAVRLCRKDYEHVLIYVSKMVDMGDMIRKMKETNLAAATSKAALAASGGTGAPVRGAYQKGRFTAPTADAAAASTPAVPAEEAAVAAPTPAAADSSAVDASSSDSSSAVDDETSRFVAFARIWCGTLRVGPGAPPVVLHIFGPKYDPADPETHAHHSSTITLNDPTNKDSSAIALYLLMGTDIQQMTSVPAGNVFALGGLSHHIHNTATLSTCASVVPFRNMQYQSAPIVRVAIETERVGDMQQLIRGLKLLNQADANVQVKLLDSGEHVIVASGELHLERCVRDLKDRFCPGVKLLVSPPLIAFRETIQEDLVIDATKKSDLAAGGTGGLGGAGGIKKSKQQTKDDRRKEEEEETKGLEKDRAEKKARKQKELNAITSASSSSLKPSASLDDVSDARSASAAGELTPSVGQPGSEVDPAGPLASPAAAAAGVGASKSLKFKHVITDSSSNKLITLTVQALPLPKEVTRALEERVAVVKGLVVRQAEERKRRRGGGAALAAAPSTDGASGAPTVVASSADESLDEEDTKASSSADDITALLSLLRASFSDPTQKHLFSGDDVERIWAFGPRGVGPNLLLNRVEDLTHLTSLVPKAMNASGTGTSSAMPSGSQSGSVHGSVHNGGAASSEERESLFLSLQNAILTGFQLACAAGPLCEEPLMGVAFSLEAIELARWDDSKGPDPFGPMSGQTMSLMQKVCRQAFDARARRLMEAVFRVELQCSQEALGALHGVLAKRRGAIFNDELREGTTTYHIQAWLPVAESFGFAGDVRKKTGGEASPQLIFSHWEIIQQDPFFVPRSEEELEFHGAADATPNLARDLVDHVRRRKGLAIQQKTVEHAEKQRTIKR